MTGQRGTAFLLLGMMGWVFAAFAGASVAYGVAELIPVLANGFAGHDVVERPGRLTVVLIGAGAFQGMLLWIASRNGRRLADGDRRAGLGVLPIRRPRAVGLCCAGMLMFMAALAGLSAAFPALRAFMKSVTPDFLSDPTTGGPIAIIMYILVLAVLAPISEELFFRGWLWEALRRRGHSAAVTAILTAVPWLLLHGLDSPGRIVFLLPAGVVFSLARHWSGGVKGSLLVHMTNNGAAVLLQTLDSISART